MMFFFVLVKKKMKGLVFAGGHKKYSEAKERDRYALLILKRGRFILQKRGKDSLCSPFHLHHRGLSHPVHSKVNPS